MSHQQSFRYKGTGLPGLNQYKARINVLAQGHNAVMLVRLKPSAPQSRVKHSTTEPLHEGLQKSTDSLKACFENVNISESDQRFRSYKSDTCFYYALLTNGQGSFLNIDSSRYYQT